MENVNNRGRLILGSLLTGAIVGGTLGVLFAPHKGTKTRKNIAKNVKNTASKFRKEMDQDGQYLKKKALDFENILEDKISVATSSFKNKVNELLKSGSDHVMDKTKL
jgi:gas vesicle protein